MLLLLIAFWFADHPAEYAGATICGKCHSAQLESQSRTAHARALAPAAKGGPARWAFGAGLQAITFVRRLDPEYYLEEGESWYRAIDGFARTPGHATTGGVRDRIFDPSATILRCFACHSTGPLRMQQETGIVPLELGVRCEACHGPGTAHARDPAANRPQNPGRMTADAVNRLCGECHRMPMKQNDETSLRNPWNARHQPLLLAASRCFQQSEGRLSCLTCHRPHEPLDTSTPKYDAVCNDCHAGAAHRVETRRRACADCHMPAVRPQEYLKFTNHRIAIYAPSDPLAPVIRRR